MNHSLALTYLCLKVMNQNGTDQHTTHKEKCLAKVEDNYNVEKKTPFYNKQMGTEGQAYPHGPKLISVN